MILRNIVTVFCVDIFGLVLAASYSNVYFQPLYPTNGVPVDVVNYGGPGLYPSSQDQVARFSLSSVLPDTTLVAYRPVSNANLVGYKLPYEPFNDVSSNYGYSYATYDDGTGNKISQNDVIDHGKIIGHYLLHKPDGNVRDVQYTADDVKGFKAFVTNLLWGKVISSNEENNATKDSEALLEDPSTLVSQGKVITGEQGQNSSTSNDNLDKEAQLAEVKEIKSQESDTSKEPPVKAAVEEIESKPNGPTNNIVIDNIINCIQSAMKNSGSPLVYIILPSKLCS